MSTALRDGIQRLEVTSRVTIGVLALASGVYTFLGVRELLNGNTTTVFFAAVIYSVAVTIGIFAFWSFLMRLLPHVLDHTGRFLLFLAMLLGSAMIIAMSAWLNASALAGAAALEQHLANTLQSYSRDLDQAHRYALSAQGLLPDIQMASARFSQLADGEKIGTLTGTSGSGTVVQLLSQMSNQLAALSRTVDRSGEQVKALYEQGEKHLAKMRELVSSRGPVGPRSDASVASAVQRTADDLAAGFIAPAAGGRSADLAERQTAVVTRVQEAVAAQSKALSVAAGKIVADKPAEPTRFVPLSSAEAVLRYAGDFIPSWAGAISIDLMPAVLVLILCVAHASIRRQATPEASLSSMTASELITAIRLAREVEAEQEVGRRRPPDVDTRAVARPEEQEQMREPDENVTPLALATARAAVKKD
jgi:prepilin signal peptidase PulO-like enzyme (type II secretory pathway)